MSFETIDRGISIKKLGNRGKNNIFLGWFIVINIVLFM